MPVPTTVNDSFTGSDGATWNAMWTTRNVIGTSPAPTIHGNQGRMQTSDPTTGNDDRIITYLADTFGNFDVTFKYTNVVELRSQAEFGYRVGSGITSGTPTSGYVLAIVPGGSSSGNIYLYTINDYTPISITHGAAVEDHSAYWFRVRVKGSRHLVKWWADGDTEPPGWNLDVTDATYTSGQFFLGVYNVFTSPPNTWYSTTIDWDDFSLLEVLPPDPGFRVESDPVVAVKIGDVDVITAFKAGVEVPVTWP